MLTSSDYSDYSDFTSQQEEPIVDSVVEYALQMIDSKHKDWLRAINYNDIDRYDFSKRFIEVIRKPEFVHVYFDFDSIETLEDWEQLLNWHNSLVPVFGNFSIGGYTNNNETFGKLFKYIPNAHHTLSLHVVFYETKIKSDVLIELMKHDKQGYKYNVNPQCDPNVYKLKTRQLMRHVLSDKYYNKNNEKNAITAGTFLNDSKPSQSIITVRGNENEVDYSKFSNLFGYDVFGLSESSESEDVKQVNDNKDKVKNTKKRITVEDINHEDKIIMFDYNQMIEFLRHFDNCFNTVLTTLAPLWHSPYSKEFLIDVVVDWYNEETHDKPEQAEDIINRYYKHEENNRWFFSLLKHLPEDVREQYRHQHKDNIDFSININNSNITYENVKQKRYSVNNIVKLINDLRGCIGVIDDLWYLKTMKNEQPHITFMNEEKIAKKLKTYKPFKETNSVSVYSIVSKFSNFFMYEDAGITKDAPDNYINLFIGFKYQEIFTDDFTILQPFLDHIKNII